MPRSPSGSASSIGGRARPADAVGDGDRRGDRRQQPLGGAGGAAPRSAPRSPITPKAARRWSRNSATGSAPARISPKASPRFSKSGSRITAEPPPRPSPACGREGARSSCGGFLAHLLRKPRRQRSAPLPRKRGRVAVQGSLRPVIREDDRGDEGPGLDEGGLVGLAAEFLHRAQQAEPVQHLVLAAISSIWSVV